MELKVTVEKDGTISVDVSENVPALMVIGILEVAKQLIIDGDNLEVKE